VKESGVRDVVVLGRVMVAVVVCVGSVCMLGVVCCERRGRSKEANLDGMYEWVSSFIVIVCKLGWVWCGYIWW